MHNEMRFEWFRGDCVTRWAPHVRFLIPIFDTCWGNEVRSGIAVSGSVAGVLSGFCLLLLPDVVAEHWTRRVPLDVWAS